jgi:glycosyltransferase involved in cell wall biosynthesis
MSEEGVATDRVSCIIPVHNGERFLREAIDSILAQSHPPSEIVVVDDGSSDRTPEVARGYEPEITYLHQEQAGPAAARNAGLAAAAGEFIAFLDADDKWRSEKLERQLLRFGTQPDLGVCVTLVQNFWESEMAEEAARFSDHPRSRPMPGYSTVTMLTRREVFEAVGAFNAALAHGDSAEWFLRCEEAGVMTDLMPEVLVDRRLHRDNRSRRRASASRDEFLDLLKSSLDRRRDSFGRDDDGG